MTPLSYRDITLRQVLDDDMPFIFRLLADPHRGRLWMPSRRVYDERAFREAWSTWMNGIFAAKFVVERGGRPLHIFAVYREAWPEVRARILRVEQPGVQIVGGIDGNGKEVNATLLRAATGRCQSGTDSGSASRGRQSSRQHVAVPSGAHCRSSASEAGGGSKVFPKEIQQ